MGLATGTALASATGAGTRIALGGALNEIVSLDATTLVAAIRDRRLSCAEIMAAYLDHIDRINPHVNAIVALQDRANLLAQAHERDVQLTRGESIGVLHGVPLAIKDLQPVKGIRTTEGSPIFRDFVPASDSLMVARLRQAGAIFIGKTNTPEFGLGSHTYNPIYGPTRNAFEPSRSAGGSSGGAAVSLALRMLAVADGSDFGGSLRNPAGWNNVFGFRTSIGRVPAETRDGWLPSMSVSGPMARNVRDLALLLSVQAGYDARAPLSLDGDGSIFRGEFPSDCRGKRIAWGGDLGGHAPCERGVLPLCETALASLESLGCHIEPALPDYDLEAVWRAVVTLRAWQVGGELLPHYRDPKRRALLKPEAVYEIETGLALSAADITAASVVRTEWYQAMRRLFERYDYFVLPTAQVFPFALELHWPDRIGGRPMQTYHEWMKAQLLVTMSGCPSLAVPAGFSSEALPMGIQFVAPNRCELQCLQLARAYEQAAAGTLARLPALLS